MAGEQEYGTKMRLLLIMRGMLEWPYGYTRKQFKDRFGVDLDTIKSDFEAFRNAGFDWEYDQKYRYAFKADKLEKARAEKRQALLIDYRSSNSNVISDRLVEPFHAKAEDDILQAFDVDKQELRHFRFSRVKRIQVTDFAWAHEDQHKILATDPFRIVDDEQVMVHLRLKVGAYNELIERFPATKAFIQEDAAEKDIFDFQARVNHKFYGLTNLILGFHHQIVEVLEPEGLKAHLRKEADRMTGLMD